MWVGLVGALWACDRVETHPIAPPPDETATTPPEPPLALTDVYVVMVPDLGTVPRVAWTQGGPASATITYTYGDHAGSTPTHTLDAGAHSQVVLGLPFGVEATLQVVLEANGQTLVSEPQVVRTAPWPKTLPVPILLTAAPERWDAGLPYVVTSMNRVGDERTGDWWVFVLDRSGNVVWARPSPHDFVSRYVRIGRGGSDLLVDYDSFWPQDDLGAASQVVRLTLDGVVSHTYPTPFLHHAFTEHDDGAIVWLALDDGYENETLERLDAAGVQSRIWDCQSQFYATIGQIGSCGTNGLYWDAAADRYLISSWAIDTVIEIDGATGALNRYFGQLPGAWSFDPPESEFDWQHGPIYTDAGTLMVSSKRWDPEASRNETVAYEYALDEGAQTLREVWSFGKGQGIYGAFMGEVHRLPGGNTLHNYGEEARLREVTPDGEVVWEVWWEGDAHIGRSTPFADLYDLVPDPT